MIDKDNKNNNDKIVDFDEMVDSHLSLLKRRQEKVPSTSFRSSVMARVKASNNLEEVEPFLSSLKSKKEHPVPASFRSSVMARIKASDDLENVDIFLETLKVNRKRQVPASFKHNVMTRIKSYEEKKSKVISPFNSINMPIYKRFLAVASLAAAVALIIAFWSFSSYTPELADFMATDFLNIGLY